jgi:hypothetical protein
MPTAGARKPVAGDADDWPLPARAFHLADVENWPAIQRSGLHCTAALIARAGLRGRAALPYASYRAEAMRLPSGAMIRDQRPMPPEALRRCLDDGLAPEDWYRLVNARVFFWLDVARLNRHLAACRARPQLVIAIDLRALVAGHGERACVTPFNVGNARRRAAARGRRTFVPLASWLAARWASEARPGDAPRARSHPPAELAIEGAVPDLKAFIVDVRPIAAGQSYSAARSTAQSR